VALPLRFQLGNCDFDVIGRCGQRLRFTADCAAGERQQFIPDFRGDSERLIIFYRAIDQVERSQVIHRQGSPDQLIDLHFSLERSL